MARPRGERKAAPSSRVPTGVPGLDSLLGGGVWPGSTTLLAGAPGTGKTVLACQFLRAFADHGKPAVYVALGQASPLLEQTLPLLGRPPSGKRRARALVFDVPTAAALLGTIRRRTASLSLQDTRIVFDVLTPVGRITATDRERIRTAHSWLSRQRATVLVCATEDVRDVEGIAASRELCSHTEAVLLLTLRTVHRELERRLWLCEVKDLRPQKTSFPVVMDEEGLSIGSEGEADTTMLISAPRYLDPAPRRLYAQRVRRQLAGDPSEAGVRPVPGRLFFTDLMTELHAPRTDFGLVLAHEPGLVPHLARLGVVAPVDEELPEYGDLFLDLGIRRGLFASRLYAVPKHISVRLLYYRKDLLDRHGLRPPRTWDDLFEQAEHIAERERDPQLSKIRFEFRSAVRAALLVEQVWSAGEELFENGPNWIFNMQACTDALTRIRRLQALAGPAALGNPTTEHWDSFQAFLSGKSIFLYHWSDGIRLISELDQETSQRFGWCRLPTVEVRHRPRPLVGGVSYVIPKNTRFPDAARRALRRLIEPAFSARMEADFGWPFPAEISLYDDRSVMAARPYYAQAATLLEGGRLLEETGYVSGPPFEWRGAVSRDTQAFFAAHDDGLGVDAAATAAALAQSLRALLPEMQLTGLAQRAVELIERQLGEPMTGERLASQLGVSRAHLAKTFKAQTRTTLLAYWTDLRIKKAKELLQSTHLNVSQVADRLGFRNVHHFSRVFKNATGQPPSLFKR